MPLREFVQNKLITCKPETSIQQVAQLMRDENVGAILIVKDKKPAGIVTDRDLTIRCVADGEDCMNTLVESIMTKTPATVNVQNGIYDVIKTMKKHSVRRIPLVDNSGKAVALLSFGDVTALLSQEMNELAETLTTGRNKLYQKAAA